MVQWPTSDWRRRSLSNCIIEVERVCMKFNYQIGINDTTSKIVLGNLICFSDLEHFFFLF